MGVAGGAATAQATGDGGPANALSVGGAGGAALSFRIAQNGGQGGQGTATASSSTLDGNANASATAIGGTGGLSALSTGGTGGQATALARSTAMQGGAANATATATGGAGGTTFSTIYPQSVAGVANASALAVSSTATLLPHSRLHAALPDKQMLRRKRASAQSSLLRRAR